MVSFKDQGANSGAFFCDSSDCDTLWFLIHHAISYSSKRQLSYIYSVMYQKPERIVIGTTTKIRTRIGPLGDNLGGINGRFIMNIEELRKERETVISYMHLYL